MSRPFFLPGIEKPKSIKTVSVWEVFVQILLPLVLLLMFVVVQIINRYIDAAENAKQRAKDLTQYIEQLQYQDVDQKHREKQQALLDLQYQILLNALQQIEEEKREEAKLNVFSGRVNHIQRNKTKVTDQEFRDLCQYAHDIFNTDEIQRFRNDIYKQLLEHVFQSNKIQDVSTDGLQVRKHATLPEMDQDSIRIARPDQVTDNNRARIHNEIIEFTNQLREDVRIIQRELLGILAQERLQEILAYPEGMDPELRQLVLVMVDPATDAEVRKAARTEFLRKITKKWRKEFENDDYYFLNMLWDKIDAL